MNVEQAQKVLAEAKKSLDLFQSSGSETSRLSTYENALQLIRILEPPRLTALKMAFSPFLLMATKVAHDLNIFSTLAQAASPVPVSQLAAAKLADPTLVVPGKERIMRVLVAHGFVEEPEPREYQATAISKEMTQNGVVGTVEFLFLDFLPVIHKTPEYLKATGYRNPDDSTFSPLQYAYQIKKDCFSWLGDDPAILARFNSMMEGPRGDLPFWTEWFPVRERILQHPDLTPDRPLIVDVGGGHGHDLMQFTKRFPDVPGRRILQDLPAVIEEVRGIPRPETARFEMVPYDFFTQIQPVQGARIYYLRFVLHDWPDDRARIILSHLKPAMKRGYSKILIEENILPDHKAGIVHSVADLVVMASSSGMERSRQRWEALLKSVGLRVEGVWRANQDWPSIIEAELAE